MNPVRLLLLLLLVTGAANMDSCQGCLDGWPHGRGKPSTGQEPSNDYEVCTKQCHSKHPYVKGFFNCIGLCDSKHNM